MFFLHLFAVIICCNYMLQLYDFRCCNNDGLILKPTFPAKAIDLQIIKVYVCHSWYNMQLSLQPITVVLFKIRLWLHLNIVKSLSIIRLTNWGRCFMVDPMIFNNYNITMIILLWHLFTHLGFPECPCCLECDIYSWFCYIYGILVVD